MRRLVWLFFGAFLAASAFADGFVWLDNRNLSDGTNLYNAPIPHPGGACFRVGLFAVDKGGFLSPLYPQTSFSNESGVYLHPVPVRVPARNPGDPLTVMLRIFNGEDVYVDSPSLRVTLGSEASPAKLDGFQSSVFIGPDGLQSNIPLYQDLRFKPVFARSGPGADVALSNIVVQADAKILVTGNFTSVNSTNATNIVRLLPSGAVDAGFTGELPPNSTIGDIRLLPGGKLLLAGTFPGAGTVERLIRFEANGRRDLTFSAALSNEVTAFFVQPDQSIVVGVGNHPARLLRLLPDGSLDRSFYTTVFESSGESSRIRAIYLTPTNTLSIGGEFSSMNGQEVGAFVQLDSRGAINTMVGAFVIEGAVYGIGTNLIGGAFTNVNQLYCGNLLRISADNRIECGRNIYLPLFPPGPSEIVERISPDGQFLFLNNGTSRSFEFLWGTTYAPRSGLNAALDRTNLYVTGFVAVGAASQTLRRYIPTITYNDNVLLGIDLYSDFLLLRPRHGWMTEIEYSDDLQTWQLNPDCIRDTLNHRARFYRIRPSQ